MNRIAELRKKSGLSQSELATKVGIAQNTLSQYETNLRNPKHDIILKIAEALHVFPHELYGDAEWKECNIKFASDVANAFALLHEIQEDNDTPWIIKKAIKDTFPDFDGIYNQLPDLIANITTASVTSEATSQIAGIMTTAATEGEIPADKAEKLLLSFFRALNEKGRAAAIERVADLADIPRYRQDGTFPDTATDTNTK